MIIVSDLDNVDVFEDFFCYFQGKSLSLICGAFKWLRDFKEQQQKELDELLAKKM